MTLSIAWIRKINKCEELVIASDSRLNGGGIVWDQCPKIITLPRSDSAICFAGNTHYTYPLMSQLFNAIQSYTRSQNRAMDLHDLRGYALNVFNSLQASIRFDVSGMKEIELKNTEFILAGYSWIRKKFSFWNIYYNKSNGEFIYNTPMKFGNFGQIIFAGDRAKDGKNRLSSLLQQRFGKECFYDKEIKGFDMEPLEALMELLKESNKHATIGGPPQIVKIYQHMNCRPIGIYWPKKEPNNATLLGRKLYEYEDSDYWFLNPDTLKTEMGTSKGKK